MDISLISHSNSINSLFLKPFTWPKIGRSISFLFSKYLVRLLTKMWVDFSGFNVLVKDLDDTQAKFFLSYFNKFNSYIDDLNRYRKKDKALDEIVLKLTKTVRDNIELLEEKLFSNYSYIASTNYPNNDWNDPENDHWDNF